MTRPVWRDGAGDRHRASCMANPAQGVMGRSRNTNVFELAGTRGGARKEGQSWCSRGDDGGPAGTRSGSLDTV